MYFDNTDQEFGNEHSKDILINGGSAHKIISVGQITSLSSHYTIYNNGFQLLGKIRETSEKLYYLSSEICMYTHKISNTIRGSCIF